MTTFTSLPQPKDLYDLVNAEVLTPKLTGDQLLIAQSTTRYIVNEPTTLNEIYNAVSSGLPTVNSFFKDINLSGYTRDTLKKYSLILIPYQILVIAIIIIIALLILMVSGAVKPELGIVMILVSILFLILFGIIQLQVFEDFLVERGTTLQTNVNNAYNKYFSTFLQDSALGYVAASQLTINNGVKGAASSLLTAGETGIFVPNNGGTGTLLLTQTGSPTNCNLINPPYYKLTSIQTQTPSGSEEPAIFYTILNEPPVFPDQVLFGSQTAYRLTPKPQNAKVIYIANTNTFSTPDEADSGIIKIVNASNQVPSLLFDSGVVYPLAETQGVNIYPGEVKSFINIGCNFNMTGNGTQFSLAPTIWVEVTSDIRPNGNTINTNSSTYTLRPSNKVYFVQMPGNSTLTLSTQVAVPNQELYIITSLKSSGTLTINGVNPPGLVLNNNSTAYFIAKPALGNAVSWDVIFPS